MAATAKVAPAEETKAEPTLDENGKSKEEDEPENDETKNKKEAKKAEKEIREAKNAKKMKNGCQQCAAKVMRVLGNDAIYGSFFGPHPVSFLFFCYIFKKKCPCTKQCSRPFCVASIATKLMNFIMLGIITLLAGFFIIPWPSTLISFTSTSLSSFYPCQGNKMIRYQEANGGCDTHAGYFMAYRCFLAFATLMLTMCLVMIRVTSTKDDPYRTRFHHGFWFYKYLYLFALLLVCFLMLNGERDPEGIFEFVMSIFGNIAHMIFSYVEVTLVLDLVELWVYENKTGNGKWAKFIYWAVTGLTFFVDIIIYIKIWIDFSQKRLFRNDNDTLGDFPEWPKDNCIEGEKGEPDWAHTGLILASSTVVMCLLIATSFRKMCNAQDRFPYTGWLQTGIMIFLNFMYLWSALYSSSHIHSRPRCNAGIDLIFSPSARIKDPKQGIEPGSWDVYLRLTGLFHGILAVSSLFYLVFVHGPRSHTAPLSLLFLIVFQVTDRVPAYPDDDENEAEIPPGYIHAIANRKVWDDEQMAVAHCWSIFYLMMIFGSFSLMMAMTNFTNPWAADHYNSSNVAFWFKFWTIFIITTLYISILLIPCKDVHAYGMKSRKIRKRSVFEAIDLTTITVEHATDDDENDPEGKKKKGFQSHLAEGYTEDVEKKDEKPAGEVAV